MTNSTLKTKLLFNLNNKRNKNLLQKGFTLVELMVVIVIVGVLSAVALPNFLSQTDKAKATEAKSVASAYLKQIYSAYQEGGTTSTGSADGTGSIPCPDPTKYFSYACDPTDATASQIVATGLTASGNLEGKTITSSVNLTGTDAAADGSTAAVSSGTVTIGNPE